MGTYRDLMLRDLQIRGYAVNTQKAYIRHVRQFVGHFMRPADTLTLDDGGTVDISSCPDGHGKVKSPMCCGEDMTCSVA